ncbi:MAG: MgtC/SapB family protein [Minisyncoccia bacterium]
MFLSLIWSVIKDLFLAMSLGIIIGLERKIIQGEAGMRTFSLISLGASLFMIIPRIFLVTYFKTLDLETIRMLMLIFGQIIVGIGFLGAGVIIFQEREGKLKGLTTATVMWVTAAIGAGIGLQLYYISIIATILVLLINIILLPIEKKIQEKIG